MTPDQIRSIGESLFGPRWQTKLARALPCETRTIRHWLSGKRKIRPMVEARIRSLIEAHLDPSYEQILGGIPKADLAAGELIYRVCKTTNQS